MSTGQKSVIVVGAGIIGSAIGYELQRRGHAVTLVDRQAPGRGTSYGNMASLAVSEIMAVSRPATWKKIPGWMLDPEGPVWLRPSYAPRMAGWFLRFAIAGRPLRIREIEEATAAIALHVLKDFETTLSEIGAADLVTEEGCLSIYETEAEFAEDREHVELLERYGFEHSVLSGAALRDLEPSLAPHVAKAVLLPDNRSIRDPYRLVVKLAEAMQGLGGTLREAAVKTVRAVAGGSEVVLDGGEVLKADHVVLAAGVLTRNFARDLGEPIPLETERGYHTQIMKPGISMRHSIIWPHRAFMVTPTAGGIRVGGNVELAGMDAAPDYRRPRVLVRHAQRVLPGLAVEEASDWMGHRPAMPDTLPVISPSKKAAGVFYATGHGHLGLTQSITTSRLIADMVEGKRTKIDMAPFDIGRFARFGL